jgi:transcriptional regulator with XRE-family HTH domain
MTTKDAPTGMDLKILRISLHLSARQVSAAAGISRQRLSVIEAQSRPTERAAGVIMAAIAAASR